MLFVFTLFISHVCVPSFFQLSTASTLTSDRSDRDKGPHLPPGACGPPVSSDYKSTPYHSEWENTAG